MKRGKLYAIAIAITGLSVGCGGATDQSSQKPRDTTITEGKDAVTADTKALDLPTTVSASITTSVDTIFAGESDTTINLPDGEAFVKGSMQAKGRRPAYTLEVSSGQTVIATIRPVTKGGNVRINQVQKPDKTFDGPFGDSLNYTLKKSGRFRILTGQNMMAGDPWSGDFILHVKVE